MTVNFIDLERQQKQIALQIELAIKNVLQHGKYIMGDECQRLEAALAQYVGVKHSLLCANGTDALRIALKVLDVKPGDMVITTNYTFFATAEVIAELGAIPLFVDIDKTFNICPDSLAKLLEKANNKSYPVKGIMSVDLFGLPADHHRINALAKQYGVWHIEDGAQGFGGKINDQVACSFGDISTTSFFPAKPLGCYGDGGAIFTNNDDYANKIKSLRVHGKGAHKYENIQIGYNSRLDTIQAAILLEKLKIFDQECAVKNNLAQQYSNAFEHIDELITPQIPQGFYSSWAQYTLIADDRDQLMQSLKQKNIPTMVYYPFTMHQTIALKQYQDYQLIDLVNSTNAAANVISLPMHAYLVQDEIDMIIDGVKSYYNK